MMLCDVCLSDVCLSVAYIGPKSRTERPRKTKIGTEIANVTRDSDATSQDQKVKGQGLQAALLGPALTCKAAAAVSVGTYSTWEITATLRLLGGARGAWAPTGEERGAGAYCVATRTACLIRDNSNNCRRIVTRFSGGLGMCNWQQTIIFRWRFGSRCDTIIFPLRDRSSNYCIRIWLTIIGENIGEFLSNFRGL